MDVFHTNCDEQADAQAFRPMKMQRRATELSLATKDLIKSLPHIEIPFHFSSTVVRGAAASSLSGVPPSPVVGRRRRLPGLLNLAFTDHFRNPIRRFHRGLLRIGESGELCH